MLAYQPVPIGGGAPAGCGWLTRQEPAYLRTLFLLVVTATVVVVVAVVVVWNDSPPPACKLLRQRDKQYLSSMATIAADFCGGERERERRYILLWSCAADKDILNGKCTWPGRGGHEH